ncbi:hypothetical protein [Exiguobacterium antarcticum]|uniref:hypothetical protein n=1 Tax=Exiguobacterium antarcticum TaxID=132920 RepID=UPI001ED99624|nr:hypothetical protein [Exiguobacterium antarcticum]
MMLFITVVTGVIGALLPAQRAVRITPNAAIGSVAVNIEATERRFKLTLGTIGVVLVAVLLRACSCLPQTKISRKHQSRRRINRLPFKRPVRKSLM